MKRIFVKSLVSAALAVSMLTVAASAAPLLIAPAPDGQVSDPQGPAYTVTQRSAAPIPVHGAVVEKGEDRIYLENSNESDPYNKIYATISPETLILDAVSGARKTFADVREGETVYAYVGPAMTRSLPPMASAELVLCNIPADYAVPTYCQIQSLTEGDDGRLSALTDRDVILHLNGDTELLSLDPEGTATLSQLKPGTKVLAWYSVVALSLPAQATPDKIMVFPYSYAGYAVAGESGVVLNGTHEIMGLVEGERLLLPLRDTAEALGCTVTWNAAAQSIDVSAADKLIYSVTVGGENATAGEGGLALLTVPTLVDGVTYLALDDLLVLHSLKLAQ